MWVPLDSLPAPPPLALGSHKGDGSKHSSVLSAEPTPLGPALGSLLGRMIKFI